MSDLVITVRVTGTIRGGTVPTNTAIIASDDSVSDVDPFTADNISIPAVTMPRTRVSLPLILKRADG